MVLASDGASQRGCSSIHSRLQLTFRVGGPAVDLCSLQAGARRHRCRGGDQGCSVRGLTSVRASDSARTGPGTAPDRPLRRGWFARWPVDGHTIQSTCSRTGSQRLRAVWVAQGLLLTHAGVKVVNSIADLMSGPSRAQSVLGRRGAAGPARKDAPATCRSLHRCSSRPEETQNPSTLSPAWPNPLHV